MHNFVIFSLSRWNIEYGCNIRDISVELARHHKVLYIDVPLKRKDRWLNKKSAEVIEVNLRIKEGKLQEVTKNLWHYIDDEILESVNSINNPTVFDFVNKLNNERFAKSIRRAIKLVGFQDYILLNDNDIYNGLYLKDLLKPALYAYYLRDNLRAMAYWKRQVTRLEPLLIKKVDVVVANSQYLADYAATFNTNSYYVGQGCDIQHFLDQPDNSKIQSALQGIPKPIVGYIGALNSERLDVQLLSSLAQQMSDFNFVLVGQEDEEFSGSTLHHLPNVYFLGKKDFGQLPELLYGFDVTINPQRLNEITIGNYPRKVDEYLAAGKPVIATETQAMRPFADHVYLGTSVSEYIALIKTALEEDSKEKRTGRQLFAKEHTWENNVIEMVKAFEISLNGKQQ